MKSLPLIDYDAHPAYEGVHRDDEKLRRHVEDTFGPLLDYKRQTLAASLDTFQSRATSGQDSVIDDLGRTGVGALKLPAKALAELRRLCAPADEFIEKRIAERRRLGEPLKFPDTEVRLRQDGQITPGMEEFGQTIIDLIGDSGVQDIAEGYYPGYGAKLWNIVFRRNVENQDFFQTQGFDNPRTAGMHIDSNSRACLNGIIYLNDVGPEQGPFKYVGGSNQWGFDPEDRAIRKAVDEAGFGSGSARKFFIQLPAEYRRKASFGYDVWDNTPLSRELMTREKMYTSDVCDMVLFDSDGVHRGGDVLKGHRNSILFVVKITAKKKRAKAQATPASSALNG